MVLPIQFMQLEHVAVAFSFDFLSVKSGNDVQQKGLNAWFWYFDNNLSTGFDTEDWGKTQIYA